MRWGEAERTGRKGAGNKKPPVGDDRRCEGARTRDGSKLGLHPLFELEGVGSKDADALGEFLGGHLVFVVEPAEGFLVEGDFFERAGAGGGGVEFAGDGAGGFLHLFEEGGTDGEEVAAGKFENFADVAEAGAHDFGLVAKFLVVVKDLGDGKDAGIFGGGVFVAAGGFLVPVQDAADEWGDEFHIRLSAGNGLGEGEEEGEVAVDLVRAKLAGGFDALPGGGNFDEDAFAGDAGFFVARDEGAGFGEGADGVEAETGVHFGGNALGDDLEDFETEGDGEFVERNVEGAAGTGGLGLGIGDGAVDDVRVFGHLGGLEEEAGVGGGVAGLVFADALEVAGVGDDDAVLFQSGKQVAHVM